MKTSGIFFMVVGLGLGLASGCAPPTVPQRPSWDVDVFPILQGSCNHCHGETVGRLPGPSLSRLDILRSQGVHGRRYHGLGPRRRRWRGGAQFPT